MPIGKKIVVSIEYTKNPEAGPSGFFYAIWERQLNSWVGYLNNDESITI